MKRILVVATRQIGDVLLTTPLIAAAHELWPQARIDMLGFAGTLGMLAGNPHVAERIETPARLGLRGTLRLVARLWRRYDLVLVTQPGDRAHLLGWFASRTRSGLLPVGGGSNWWKRLLLDHAVVIAGDRGQVHVVVEKLALLDPWRAGDHRVPRVVPPGPSALPEALADRLRAPYAVVHAPSMWRYKQWPLEHYAEVVRGLRVRGLQVVLTGSGSEQDRACVQALLSGLQDPQVLDAAGQLDFRQLAALLEGAALYVGPDTSVSHLAAATGVPTLAVFGPTNPQRWAPWPARPGARALFERSRLAQTAGNVTVFQAGLPCVPCGRAGCEDRVDSHTDCLPAILPARVLAHVDEVLAAKAVAAPR